MNDDKTKYFKVGILFFIALILLGAATVSVGHLDFFKKTYDLRVEFPNVGGLKEGDPVRVSGLEMGRVQTLYLQPHGVTVTLRMHQSIQLREDYRIQVTMSSLVGGRHIAIDQGSEEKSLADMGAVLKGLPPESAFDELGDLVKENRRSVREFLDNLNQISTSLKDGRGTLGKLLKDEELYNQVTTAIADVKGAITELKKAGAVIDKVRDQLDKGEGTLAKLLMSNDVYDDLRESTTKIREILAKAERGEGTVGKLLTDDRLYEDAKALVQEMKDAVASVKRITDKIDNGEGTAGRLINDKEMAQKIADTVAEVKETAASLRSIAAKIDRGDGTLGKLVNENSIYEKAESSLDSLEKTLGAVGKTKTYVTAGTRYYTRQQLIAPTANLRIYPKEDRYFELGGVVWPAGKGSDWSFPAKDKHGKSETFLEPTIMLGFTFMDNRLDLAGGLLEGRFGGRAGYRITLPLIEHDVTVAIEARDSWSDPDKLDEKAGAFMGRAYIDTKLWRWFHAQAGVSRIGHHAEFFAGLTFTYEDEDIRTFVSLLGLAK